MLISVGRGCNLSVAIIIVSGNRLLQPKYRSPLDETLELYLSFLANNTIHYLVWCDDHTHAAF